MSHDRPSASPAPSVWTTAGGPPGVWSPIDTSPSTIRWSRSAVSPEVKIVRPASQLRSTGPQLTRCMTKSVSASLQNWWDLRTSLLHMRARPFNSCCSFLADVYAYRTPHDAPATPDTARGSVLIPPPRQLVCDPLAVPGRRRSARRSAVHLGESWRETHVPQPDPSRLGSIWAGVVDRARAEARGTDHRAVAACQTTRRHVVPPFCRRDSQCRCHLVGVHAVAHSPGCLRHLRPRRVLLGDGRTSPTQPLEELRPPLGERPRHQGVHRSHDLGHHQ